MGDRLLNETLSMCLLVERNSEMVCVYHTISLLESAAVLRLPAFDVVSEHHLQHLSSLHQSQRLVLSGG